MKRHALAATALLAPCLLAAAPLLQVPSGLPGAPGRAVRPNVLLALSLTYHDARAAHGGDFQPGTPYEGYFNSQMCYRYRRPADEDGYFAIAAPANEGRCDRTFSGNFLNWAATSRLDLLRLALTGGDRAIDLPGLTVLQRAALPDGGQHVDFYAHPGYFPRRTLPDGDAFTPFGRGAVHVVSCRDRILFSRTATGRDCDAPRRGATGRLLVSDKRLGDYLARVQVCDEADTTTRPWLCSPYGSGAKPEGSLQRFAREARFGVMGYLSRAGSGERNLYGGVLRAPLKLLDAETDAQSGVLQPDPDAGPTGLSGTINYINRIGRDGSYKAWAPTAELYYEALRYLQGRPASAHGTPRHDGGFPVWAARPDPMTAACQRHAIALIAHPAADEDRYVPGNRVASHLDAPRPADSFGTGAALDVTEWTERAGRAAGIGGLSAAEEGEGGTGSSYVAGLALWAATHKLRDRAAAGVETVALQLGSSAGRRSALELAGSVAAGGLHVAPAAGDIIPALRAWLERSVRPGGDIASTAVALRQPGGGATVLRTTYDPAAWAGDLERIDVAGGGATRSVWRASVQLPAHRARRIYTTVANADATATVPFTHAALPRGLFADAALIDYLRGDRSHEGRGQRARGGPLGDMVRSEPVLVRAPSSGGYGESYLRFAQRQRGRASVVYVGANDGMLHAFDLDTGTERFAYVPRLLLPGLAALAQPGFRHHARLDASAGAGDARVGGEWATVLASGFGMGAKGVFAIDVTDPDDFARGRGELWQFTELDDPLVGHIHARPAIARFRTGPGSDPHRYFAVVTSGINNYGPDDTPDGALFLLSLDKRGPGRWRRGTDYHRIVAPAARADRPNALGPATLVPGTEGAVRLAYAGDLQGNLWRFDFTRPPPWPGQASLLFSARAGGAAQPITSAPAVVHAPGGYLVLFGTGRLVEDADLEPSTHAQQSFYAVLDATGHPAVTVARQELAPRTLVAQGGAFRVSGRDIDYARDRGWYFDYARAGETGERSVASPVPAGGALIVRTIEPPDDPCEGPSSRTYVLDALTGLSPRPGTFTAELTGQRSRHRAAVLPPALMSWNGPAWPAGAGGARTSGSYAFFPIDGLAAPDPVPVELPARRVSWREIPNWEDLHRAAGNPQEEP